MRTSDSFRYTLAKYPKDKLTLASLQSGAHELEKKLQYLDPEKLEISEYNQRYLGDKLKKTRRKLTRCVYVLAWALADHKVPLSQLTLLDYGAGTGLMCVLAKLAGVGQVIYNDIYDVSCRDAEKIATSLGAPADAYIQGDINDVVTASRKRNISYQGIASNDCIEHIYDIERFLHELSDLPGRPLKLALASGANPFLKSCAEKAAAFHYQVEHRDREPKNGDKQRDTLRSYLSLRQDIIRAYSHGLSAREVDELSRRTRGMNKADIEESVRVFAATGKPPKELEHPTNTCDPMTGNWAEHHMDPFSLAKTLSNVGFSSRVLGGYYNTNRPTLRIRSRLLIANLLISSLTRPGIRFAPFYVLYGRRS